MYVENGSRQQAHNAQRRTQASFLPTCPGLITPFALRYPVYPVDAICRQYIGYEGRFEFLLRLDRSLQYERRATFCLPLR